MALAWRARTLLGLTKALSRLGLAPTPEKLLRQPAEKRMAQTVPFILRGRVPTVRREDRIVSYGNGDPVRVRIYLPPLTKEPVPSVAYFHGGGWVLGGLGSCDHICARMADAGALVMSVDYRLAPEHPYPAGLDDCRGATEWFFEHAPEWGGDLTRFVVGGDSAGGNLAAATTIAFRGAGSPVAVAAQLLIYPALDLTGGSPWSDAYEGTGMGADDYAQGIAFYLGEQDPTDPVVSPLLLENRSGLPPTLVMTAGFDPLYPQGKAFAARLTSAGVPVRYLHYENYAHGFYSVPTLYPGMKETWAELCTYVQKVTPVRSGLSPR